ncbi:MAG: hypothetical protein J4F42_07520 [Desulfurellaceae bacterium]|nr:hypothetical protein [Desulfurellaceae bacterium]
MDWKNLATLLTVFVTMWWQLDRKIEYEISALDSKLDRSISTLDRKIDQLNSLLTNNLIALTRTVGELKGASHIHPALPAESAD